MKELRVLIVGSRDFNDYVLLETRVDDYLKDKYDYNIVIVSGGARGADTLAEKYAKTKHYDLKVFPAQWNKYGKMAGYIRNEEMHKYIAEIENRCCIAFWDGASRGTQHNFPLATKYNTEIVIVNYKEAV